MSTSPYQQFRQNNLEFSIFPYLSPEDRRNLGQVDQALHRKIYRFDESCSYQLLDEKIDDNEHVYIHRGGSLHPERLLRFLGGGGSKKAIGLQGDRALLLPNMDVSDLNDVIDRWKRIVDEEVYMSEYLTKVGLLSPQSQRVRVVVSKNFYRIQIPAYFSETFESLGKTKNWFIIDGNNSSVSTWKQFEHYLFEKEDERRIEKHWDSVIDSLLTDIAKIMLYNIPTPSDSLNIAVVKRPSEQNVCQYEVRYFGFDFSSKLEALALPTLKEETPEGLNRKRAKYLLDNFLDKLFFAEFDYKYEYEEGCEILRAMRESLEDKYAPEVLRRIELMRNKNIGG